MAFDAHFRTQPSFSSQKSCVKIWFGLVELFKSYRGNIEKKKKITDTTENNVSFRSHNKRSLITI